MIWHRGSLLDDRTLTIGIDDRTFEHGLGLFETLRTWNGRAPLLPRHLDRMRNSAETLGLPMADVSLPDDAAVSSLIDCAGLGPDAVLRITMTGGSASGDPPVLWMTAKPLPTPIVGDVAAVLAPVEVAYGDALARHKTLNYWLRRLASEHAARLGVFESLIGDGMGTIWEGSRTNLFLIANDAIVAPSLDGPLVPGIMRRCALDFARESGYRIEERNVTTEDLDRAEAVFLCNSVRGVVRVGSFRDRPLDVKKHRDFARRLADELPKAIRDLRFHSNESNP